MGQGLEGAPGQAGPVIRPGSCLAQTLWADWQATPLGKFWQGAPLSHLAIGVKQNKTKQNKVKFGGLTSPVPLLD